MVKGIAEHVVQSLQTLLMILLNQVATQVSTQEVPTEQVTMMSELLSEVQSQKEKIEEIALIMRQGTSPSRREEPFSVLTESDQEVWEQEVRVFQAQTPPRHQPAQQKMTVNPSTPPRTKSVAAGKGSFQAQMSPNQAVSSLVGMAAPGSPLPMSPSQDPRSQPSTSNQEQSLAWTTTAMDRWGQKMITWGKKNPGKTYATVYEADRQYVSWCLSRINSLEAPISDFARYCQTRQQMEEQLHQSQLM